MAIRHGFPLGLIPLPRSKPNPWPVSKPPGDSRSGLLKAASQAAGSLPAGHAPCRRPVPRRRLDDRGHHHDGESHRCRQGDAYRLLQHIRLHTQAGIQGQLPAPFTSGLAGEEDGPRPFGPSFGLLGEPCSRALNFDGQTNIALILRSVASRRMGTRGTEQPLNPETRRHPVCCHPSRLAAALRSSELLNDCHTDVFLGRCYLTTSPL